MQQTRNTLATLGLFCALLLLTGCAGLNPATPEQQVAKRAQERIDALRSGDFERALSYTTPAYRQITTKNRYGAKYAGSGTWTDATVQEVTCEVERCNVRISVTYQMMRPRITNTRPLDQTWILVDGKWYIHEK